MDQETLKKTAKAMVATGKGILAIDESTGTCQKRFESIGVECTEESRRQYRQLLVSAPGISEFISGMILFDETLRQRSDDGTPFTEILKKNGMIPGIKVDTGAKDMALHAGEKITEGLDNLRERLREYKDLGAEFAKWRAVITIDNSIPSKACIKSNAHALARYAALVQEAGMVPMVEPEVLIDGDHTIEKCTEVTAEVLRTLFQELNEQGISLEGTILKTSMVLSGNKCLKQADINTVAKLTVETLINNVPKELAGVVFLSGGQDDQKATEHLNAMNIIGGMPWPLSFSYGRGIQQAALNIWGENQNNVKQAQEALVKRAKLNGLAAIGKYSLEMES